jgi:hypothetical protein
MKIYATYLPGFHSDKLNNEWWGEDFSEWDIVKKAKPLFPGHIQPNIPLNGYYDLSNSDEIQSQYVLAKEHGIDAFLMYGYWSAGKQPLVTPFEVILKNKSLDVKFAYYWGNHSWTRTWSNRSGALDVLLEQEYSKGDMNDFFCFLLKLFKDERYERIDGRPLFVIYKPEDIPWFDLFIKDFKRYVQLEIGVEPFIIGSITSWQKSYKWSEFVDSVMLFQPSFSLFGPEKVFDNKKESVADKINQYIRSLPDSYKRYIYLLHDLMPKNHTVYDYKSVINKSLVQFKKFNDQYPSAIPMLNAGFDNTPRYTKRAKIIQNFDVIIFSLALKELISIIKCNENKIIVINAWNEWGEGMYLEPDVKDGFNKLKAIKKCLK